MGLWYQRCSLTDYVGSEAIDKIPTDWKLKVGNGLDATTIWRISVRKKSKCEDQKRTYGTRL